MKALVLSGGGSKGAYQIGALNYLLKECNNHYDILCGVSVGSINCGFLAQFTPEEEKSGIEELTDLWLELNTSKIYKRWFPFGGWHALWEKSFYDSSPLIHLIEKTINLEKIRATGRQVSAGAISLSSGKYTVFTQDNDDFVKAIMASASFPGMFAPIKIGDQWWSDGGVKQITPIKTAIELGAEQVDIIMTSPEQRLKHFVEEPSIIDIITRVLDLSADKIMSNDLEKATIYNQLASTGYSDKKIIKMNLIRPTFNLIDNLLDFDPEKIQKMMETGYLDAKNQYQG
jgi:NTE family protein